MTPSDMPAPGRFGLPVAAVCILIFLFFFRLGDRPLRNPDEGRYAEIAREMHLSGDWITPKLYQIDYLRKPVLFYWLIAVSFRVGGVSEWSARFVPAFFGLLMLWGVHRFARRWGEAPAWTAVWVLGTNLFYLSVCRYLIIDAVFAFFLVSAQFCIYQALEAEKDRSRTQWFALAYAGLGAAFLAKGPISILLTAAIWVFYSAVTRRMLTVMKEVFRQAWTAVAFFVIATPWFYAILKARPEFADIFFWHENFGRAVSSAFEHQEPWYFYFVLLPAFCLPWAVFPSLWTQIVKVLREETQQSRPLTFCVVSIVAMTLFFSASKGKLHTYLLPVLPFWALCVGRAWPTLPGDDFFWKSMKRAAIGVAIFCALFVLGVRFYYEPHYAHRYPDDFMRAMEYLGAAALAGSVMAFRAGQRKSKTGVFAGWVFFCGVTAVVFSWGMEALNPLYSTKRFAEALEMSDVREDSEVFLYGQPGAFYDFEFYWKRPVKIVGLNGEYELVPSHRDVSAGSVPPEDFERWLQAGRPMVVLSRLSDYDHLAQQLSAPPKVIFRDGRKILFMTGGHQP